MTDCVFRSNQCGMGGGLYCAEASPTISGCTFVDNYCGYGGGVWCEGYSTPQISDCVFEGNEAQEGGGLYALASSPDLQGCVFQGNRASLQGGGLACGSSDFAVTSCTFHGNEAIHGGGLWVNQMSTVTLERTIVSFSLQGEALYLTGGGYGVLSCCDLFGNAGGDWVGGISGQYGEEGNISADPLFCAPEEGDLRVAEDSPCAPFTPPNPECDLIGAASAGCGISAAPPPIVATGLRLGPGIPNPCLGSMRIEFTIPPSAVDPRGRLDLFDAGGRRIRTLIAGELPPGQHRMAWDGTDARGRAVPPGVYYARLRVRQESRQRPLVLIR